MPTLDDMIQNALTVNARREHALGCDGDAACSCGRAEAQAALAAYDNLARLETLLAAHRERR